VPPALGNSPNTDLIVGDITTGALTIQTGGRVINSNEDECSVFVFNHCRPENGDQPSLNCLEWTPRMEAAEGHEAGHQQESKNDFRDSSFDPLPRQELGPIEVHFFGGLGERPLQIVRGG